MEQHRYEIPTKAFLSELEWCARFIEKKSTIPVLSNVLFQKRGDFLNITATDLEIGGVTSLEIGAGPDFEIAAPAGLLIKYLKKVDESTVFLVPEIIMTAPFYGPHPETCGETCDCNLKPQTLSVTLRLEHGADGAMNVPGMEAFQYPTLPSTPPTLLQLGGLKTAIPRAVIAISDEVSRFTLNGALLRVQGNQAHLIATDGHRLSMVELIAYDSADVKALIPRKALTELVRLSDGAFFSQDDKHAFFAVGARTIVSRKLTGNFPDYERVMPKDLAYATDVSVAPLRKVLDRVALFADERSHAVLFSVNGSMAVSADSCGRGAASGKVPIDCIRRLDSENGYDVLTSGLAYPYGAGFNAEYVAEFLKSADVPDVRFHFNKCAHAAEWTAPGWRYVLMPMRMDGGSDPCATGEHEKLQWAKDADERIARMPPTVEDRVMAWTRYVA